MKRIVASVCLALFAVEAHGQDAEKPISLEQADSAPGVWLQCDGIRHSVSNFAPSKSDEPISVIYKFIPTLNALFNYSGKSLTQQRGVSVDDTWLRAHVDAKDSDAYADMDIYINRRTMEYQSNTALYIGPMTASTSIKGACKKIDAQEVIVAPSQF